jgi:ABC-2 type transport system ATP-binding protein
MNGLLEVTVADHHLQVVFTNGITAKEVNRFCFEKGIVLNRLNVKRRSLETTFLEITGNKSER